MLPIRTILQPTDFSDRSEHAFRLAWLLARDHGARLVLLQVIVPTDDQLPAPSAEVRVERQLTEGIPVPEILRAAAETHSDLIVMSTHGRMGPGRALMGSVAEQVVRRAACPVLTVKRPLPATTVAQTNPVT